MCTTGKVAALTGGGGGDGTEFLSCILLLGVVFCNFDIRIIMSSLLISWKTQ